MQADLHDISIESIIKLDLEFESSLWSLAERLESSTDDEKARLKDHLATVFVVFECALGSLDGCQHALDELRQAA